MILFLKSLFKRKPVTKAQGDKDGGLEELEKMIKDNKGDPFSGLHIYWREELRSFSIHFNNLSAVKVNSLREFIDKHGDGASPTPQHQSQEIF